MQIKCETVVWGLVPVSKVNNCRGRVLLQFSGSVGLRGYDALVQLGTTHCHLNNSVLKMVIQATLIAQLCVFCAYQKCWEYHYPGSHLIILARNWKHAKSFVFVDELMSNIESQNDYHCHHMGLDKNLLFPAKCHAWRLACSVRPCRPCAMHTKDTTTEITQGVCSQHDKVAINFHCVDKPHMLWQWHPLTNQWVSYMLCSRPPVSWVC